MEDFLKIILLILIICIAFYFITVFYKNVMGGVWFRDKNIVEFPTQYKDIKITTLLQDINEINAGFANFEAFLHFPDFNYNSLCIIKDTGKIKGNDKFAELITKTKDFFKDKFQSIVDNIHRVKKFREAFQQLKETMFPFYFLLILQYIIDDYYFHIKKFGATTYIPRNLFLYVNVYYNFYDDVYFPFIVTLKKSIDKNYNKFNNIEELTNLINNINIMMKNFKIYRLNIQQLINSDWKDEYFQYFQESNQKNKLWVKFNKQITLSH